MKSTFRQLAPVFCGLVVVSALHAAETVTVASPAAREAVVKTARQLLARSDPVVPTGIVDPFHPPAFAEAVAQITGARSAVAVAAATAGEAAAAPQPGKPRTEHDMLVAIASTLKPKAVMLGGNVILFFGEKQVRAGGSLIVTYEGNTYQLVVKAIDRTTFTLRLNEDEYTRTIKQGSAP